MKTIPITPETLTRLEHDFEEKGPLSVREVYSLFAEIRACWAALHDMRQDSKHYQRGIIDSIRRIWIAGEKPGQHWAAEAYARAVGELALTEEEVIVAWAGEPSPLAIIYDVKRGDHKLGGTFIDTDTGKVFSAPITRWCPDGGWYEEHYPWPPTVLTKIRRVWRNFRFEPVQELKDVGKYKGG